MKAEERVKQTIKDHQLINQGDMLVLGLSGGPDSLCLLNILKDLEETLGFKLYALHFNHKIRSDADEDEAFLKAYCKDKGIELTTVSADVIGMAKQRGESVEECGRKLRQEALLNYAAHLQMLENYPSMVHVVLAHNSDDQAETVLLRILRGTGIKGLAAMEYKRADGLIRPLLDTPRVEVEEYCQRKGLNPRIDSTNQSTDYLRNKLRLEIIPQLEEINPSFKEGLRRLSLNAAMDNEYIDLQTQRWLLYHSGNDILQVEPEEQNTLLIKDLQKLEPALFYRVIRNKFAEIGLHEDISAVHINSLKNAIYSNVGNKTIEFPKAYTAYINHGKLYFRKPN